MGPLLNVYRIPMVGNERAYYVVAKDVAEAAKIAAECSGKDDEFQSVELFSMFGLRGIGDVAKIKKTGPVDIIRGIAADELERQQQLYLSAKARLGSGPLTDVELAELKSDCDGYSKEIRRLKIFIKATSKENLNRFQKELGGVEDGI